MSDKPKGADKPAPHPATPADQSGVLRQPTPVPAADPLDGAHKDSKGAWVDKDGLPLSATDAELARQRLTARGEPRKQ